MALSKHVLPPGFENRDHTIYGYLYIDIGKLLWLKSSTKQDNTKVKIKFWGEDGNGQIMRPSNAARELQNIPHSIQYEIRCPLVSFYKYLEDCTKLRFMVLDARNDSPIGAAVVNLPFYLKHGLTENDLTPLNEINDVFPVQKQPRAGTKDTMTEKIGELEIKVTAAFIAQKAQRPGLQDSATKAPPAFIDTAGEHYNSSFMANEIEAQQYQPQEHSKASGIPAYQPSRSNNVSPPRPVYSQEEPNLSYNRDNRIAKSLIPGKDDSMYNPSGFRPQQIFGLDQPQASYQPANQSVQNIFGTHSNPSASFGGSANRSGRGMNLTDEQMDNQFDQLLGRAENLVGRLRDAERNDYPGGYPSFPRSPQRYEPPADNPDLNNSLELLKRKLELDRDLLLSGEKKLESGKKTAKKLSFNEIDGLKVNVVEFICENFNLRERIDLGKIFIECRVPSPVSTPEDPSFNSFRFFSIGSEGLIWKFKDEFTHAISQREGEFRKLFNSNLVFKIFLMNPDAKAGSDIHFEIASGELSLEKVILATGYGGTFNIRMSSRAPLNQAQQQAPSKADPKSKLKKGATLTTQKTLKPAASLVRSETITEVGELTVACQFTSSKVELVPESESEPVRSPRRQPEESSDQFISLQGLLYIEQIPKITPRTDQEFPFRNLYTSYKIYGTNQTVKSEVRWRTNTPYIDHKLVFPIGRELLPKMYTVPFILEVWDKSEGGKDELVGLVKLTLETIPKSLVDPETEEINTEMLSSNQYPILVYDDCVAIMGIRTGKEVGQIKIALAVGTPLQLNKYEETKLKGKRERYVDPEPRPYSPPKRKEPEEVPEPSPVKPKSPKFDKYKVNLEESERADRGNSYETFVEALEKIRKHSDLATVQSQPLFMTKEKLINAKDLSDFLLEPSFMIKGEQSRKIVKLLDTDRKGLIQREYFTRSYLTYEDYEKQLRKKFSENVKNLRTLLNQQDVSIMAFEKILNGHAEFGFVKKTVLKETFDKLRINIGPKMLEYILSLLDYENNGFVFVTHLTDYLKALEVYDCLNYLNLNPHFFIENVTSITKEVLKVNNITKEKLDTAFQNLNQEDQILKVEQVIQIMIRLGCDLTFWEALSIMEHVKGKMNVISTEENRTTINGKVFYTWLYLVISPEPSLEIDFVKNIAERYSPAKAPQILPSPINSDRPPIPRQLTPKKPEVEPPPKQDEHNESSDSIDALAAMLNAPKEEIREIVEAAAPVEVPPEDKRKLHRGLLKHTLKFSVESASQLDLGRSHEGDHCVISYIFPNTQDRIESNTFEYHGEVQDYEIDVVSKYTWTLNKSESLLDHLKKSSNGVLLQVVKKDEIGDDVLGYTILPIEDIAGVIDKPLTEGIQSKVEGRLEKTMLLFRNRQTHEHAGQSGLIMGKLSVVLEYERLHPFAGEDTDESVRRQTIMEKETSVLREVPKKGYFNFRVDTIFQLKRGLEYLVQKNREVKELLGNKFEGGARLTVYFDIFWEESDLREKVAPFEIELPGRHVDFDEILVDKTASKYVKMTSEIIEYIQHKTAKVEVRLYMENNEEDEEVHAPGKEGHYVIVCGSKIPLLQIFISDNGVQGTFRLTNNMELHSGLINLQITLNKDSKADFAGRSNTMRAREKVSYVTVLSFNEIISVIDTEDKNRKAIEQEGLETSFYFEFNVEGETKRSQLCSLNKLKEKIALHDCFFIFTVEGTSDFFKKVVEVKLLEKKKPKFQDRVLGLLYLDFTGIFKRHLITKKTFIESFYCPLTDVEKAKTLKTRVGVKAAIIKSRTKTETKKLTEYLDTILSGNLAADSKKFKAHDNKMTKTLSKTKLRDTFKQETKLKYAELDELGTLLSEEGEMVPWEIFTSEVRPDLHLDQYLDPPTWKSMVDEFVFYDYSGEGFIGLESAKSIVVSYSDQLQDLQDETLNKFKVATDLSGLHMGYPNRVKDMIDYVVLLNKIETVDIREQYQRINENTRKVDAFLSSKMPGTSHSPLRSRSRPHERIPTSYRIRIEVQYGKNFQQLNHGKPPSSLIRCELGARTFGRTSVGQDPIVETHVISRSSEPDFNFVKELTVNNFDEMHAQRDFGFMLNVFHRSYNPNYSEELHKVQLIGEGFLSLQGLVNQEGKLSFNDFVEIHPAVSNASLTRTARPMIKLNITGEPINTPGYETRDKGVTFTDTVKSPYRPYQRNLIDEDEVPVFDEHVKDNLLKTLAEVNKDVKSIQGSAKKARRLMNEEEEEEYKDYRADEEDDEEFLKRHLEARNAIQGITKGLDNLIPVDSFGGKTRVDQESFGRDHEEIRPQRDNEERKRLDERTEKFDTGKFVGGFDQTNPFQKNLSPFAETQPQRKPVHIDQDVREEMPSELDDIVSSLNDKASKTETGRFREEPNKENDSINRPSTSEAVSSSGTKPPLNAGSSTSSVRRLEQMFPSNMRNSAELKRIAKIMKPGGTGDDQKKKASYYSSDSD